MATLPNPAPEYCPTRNCDKPRMVWDKRTPEHTLYQCGTTALMNYEGWHNDGRTYAEVNRTLALWRQHLRATGRTPEDDGGLLAFRPSPPEPDAPVAPRRRHSSRGEGKTRPQSGQ